jgi:hypothetical protein
MIAIVGFSYAHVKYAMVSRQKNAAGLLRDDFYISENSYLFWSR